MIEKSRHGGDIYRHEIQQDFSVNINPLGVHERVMEALQASLYDCNQYPDYTCEKLVQALTRKTGLMPDQIVCGNGASDLFMGIIHAMKPERALVFAPSFYGYTYALNAVCAEILYETLTEKDSFILPQDFVKRIPPDINMLFLCMPNNPTGALLKKAQILQILTYCREHGIVVVYDQCFLEFTSQYEQLRGEQFLREYTNVIVVNAFTKTHAIPGIRLGYACGEESMMQKIADQLAEWRVSIPAMRAGIAALWVEQNTDYMERTRALLEEERQYLTEQMERLGIIVYPSEADYIFIKSEMPLYEELLKHKILIRACGNYMGLTDSFYRIAIKQHVANKQLIEAIYNIKQRREAWLLK